MHEQAISPILLSVLRALTENDELREFSLGGGTSLALRYGHRRSIDIDFFSPHPFDSDLLRGRLQGWFPGTPIVNRTEGSLCAVITGIKVDFLHHGYPRLAACRT